jgi:putative transposase
MYHVVFVCKYRRVILEPISEELKQVMFDIAEESDFEILEMETDNDHIHFLIKSEPKVSILSIVRKLKQESTNRLWKTQKNIWKIIIGVKIRYGVMVILRLQLEMLVKKLPNIIYGIRVKLTLISREAEDFGVLRLIV